MQIIKKLTIISLLITLFIWFLGALAVAGNLEFQRKKECISTEGLIKGWLWCSTDDTSRYSQAHFGMSIVQALKWPIELIIPVSSNYQTKEFNDPNSRIPSIFLCMFAGHQTGLGTNATELGIDLLLDSGVRLNQIDLWAQDAKSYISIEMTGIDFENEWVNNCEKQFSDIETLYEK